MASEILQAQQDYAFASNILNDIQSRAYVRMCVTNQTYRLNESERVAAMHFENARGEAYERLNKLGVRPHDA